MNKLEKGLFENLTQNSGFYIKDYYSEYLNSSKWMAILENNDFVYAVIVCKYNDCDFDLLLNEITNYYSYHLSIYLKLSMLK